MQVFRPRRKCNHTRRICLNGRGLTARSPARHLDTLISLLHAIYLQPIPTMRRYNPYFYNRRSHYVLTKNEIARGIANRFVHSRTYIFLYLGMACLSATTVGLSLAEGCPGLAFYILEIIVNSAMILEVGIRFVAFGKVNQLHFATSRIKL